MNEIVQKQQNTPERDMNLADLGVSIRPSGTSFAPENMAAIVRFSKLMAQADVAIPKHLRGNAGACMAVTMQAIKWEMDPFSVANKSYSVNDRLAYEAQLIAAVVNTRSGIKGRLKYEFNGSGKDLTCTVSGVIDGQECDYTSPPFGEITTKNSPLWKTDPQQQLGYYSARSWARRHCPEVILGVYDRDEVEQFRGPNNAKDVTPSKGALKYLNKSDATSNGQQEGFDSDFVESELDAMNSGGDDAISSPDQGGGGDFPNSAPPPDSNALRQVKDELFAIFDMEEYEQSAHPVHFAKTRAGKIMGNLQSTVLDDASPETHKAAEQVLSAFNAVADGKRTIEQADEWFAEIWGG